MKGKMITKAFTVFMAIMLIFTMMPMRDYGLDEAWADEHDSQVHVIVENNTYSEEDGAAWAGTLIDTWVDIDETSNMMTCFMDALGDEYTQTGAESGYISEINGLAAFDGGSMSGWMGTLNDWFTNEGFDAFTVKSGKLEAGDEIRIMYTCEGYGEDLGGSWNNNDKNLQAIAFSEGTLNQEFTSDVKDYTLQVPEGTETVIVTPTATNKNFQVRTSVGDIEYKRTFNIPITHGTVIKVKCGDPAWPTMNGGSYGDADTVQAVTYTFTVNLQEETMAGEGTEEAPYLIANASNLKQISEESAEKTFANTYFKFTEDITLPTEWTPIGTKSKRFAGHIDGAGHLLTIPEGEKALLGYTTEATLKNLNIYGTRIESNGVVAGYTTGVKGKTCITIENVTLKKGTQTLESGFIGGYASGDYPVVIRNCKVEEGVIIGYTGDKSNIGSFGGDFNGTIVGCESDATVKGVNYIGGICGNKGQTMGDYIIVDCIFGGTVVASGNYVGGISGGGYGGTQWGLESAPNTPCVTILNCLSKGTISGGNYVGGILGAEPGVKECWNNGVGYIQSNLFVGKVSASAVNAYIGGVIGYLSSINNAMVISNNYFADNCGATLGIGKIEMVETRESVGSFGSGWNKYTLNGVKYGRTDDPLGKDADKLVCAVSASKLNNGEILNKLNEGSNSSGIWKAGTEYPTFDAYGEKHLIRISCGKLSISSGVSQTLSGDALIGKELVLTYNDGSVSSVSATDAEVKKLYKLSASDIGKYVPAIISYQGHELEFNLNITAQSPIIAENANIETETGITIGENYSIDLTKVFTEIDGLDLNYSASVKVPDEEEFSEITTVNGVVTYTPATTGNYEFSFKADNTFATSKAVTVKLNVGADEAVIYLTVSNKGEIGKASDNSIMVNRPVTVTDLNKDGKLTVDEAMKAAHKTYMSEIDYSTTESTYGLSVSKLWAVETTNTLLFVNGTGLASGVGTDTVKKGDYLVASINKDDNHFADWYSEFNVKSKEVKKGTAVTLNLKGHLGMAWTEEDAANVSLQGITIKTSDGVVLGTTDSEGNVTFTLNNAGTYYITAQGNVKDQVDDYSTYPLPHYVEVDCPIIAPGLVLVVKESTSGGEITDDSITVYFTLLGDYIHDESTKSHTLKNGGLTTWISAKSVKIGKNSKVMDVLAKVLSENGYQWYNDDVLNGTSGNYIQSIKKPGEDFLGEFTNGNKSGWMYTLNGSHPLLGVSEQVLSNKDIILFHYTDDYTKEEGSEKWNDSGAIATVDTQTETKYGVETSGSTAIIATETKVIGTTATSTVSSETAAQLVKQVQAGTIKEVVLKIEETATKTASVKMEIPSDTLKTIAKEGTVGVKVETPKGDIQMPKEVLTAIAAAAWSGDVSVNLAESKPTAEQKALTGENAKVLDIKITVGKDNISSFNGGKLSVKTEVPTQLKGKPLAAICIDNGKQEVLSGKKITENGKTFYTFDTTHLSTFAIVDANEAGIKVQTEEEIVKDILGDVSLKAVSSKTSNKNIKVTLTLDKTSKAAVKELKAMGYVVKYKYYRSEEKSSKYQLKTAKQTKVYTNTKGIKNKEYYYKARVVVYDKEGKMVAQTALKQCKYAARIWTK